MLSVCQDLLLVNEGHSASKGRCWLTLLSLDVDECLDINVDCGQLCINSIGTYDCACEEGYRMGSDGRTCLGQ